MSMVLDEMKTEVSSKCYSIPDNFKGIHQCWVNDFIFVILSFNKAVVIITSVCSEKNYFQAQPFKTSVSAKTNLLCPTFSNSHSL